MRMCEPFYPLEILPREGYKIDGFALDNIVTDYPEICISRRIDEDINEYIDNDEGRPHLDTDCFGEHYVHLSVNLMNSLFRNEHIKYRAKGEAGKPWKGQAISIEDYKAHIESQEDSTAVFYKVDSLHKHPFQAKQSLAKDQYNAMREFLGKKAMEAFSGRTIAQEVEFVGYVSIDHVPVNLNYWHCQVEIYPKDIEKQLQNNKSWREEIFTHVLNNILSYDFSTTAESSFEIAQKHYIG